MPPRDWLPGNGRSLLRTIRSCSLRDPVVYSLLAALAAAGLLIAAWGIRHSIAIHRLTRGVGDTVFYDADGRPWFRLDEYRRDVPLREISPHIRHAVVAVEDHRFYRHAGVDLVALGRAAFHNLRAGHVVEGGSTITQQLARTLFLSNARSLGRKTKEAVLAVMLEQQLDKDQILELYLNRVYLGQRVYGVETMAEKCFGRRARDVSLAEAALIAGVIRAPSSLSPWANPEAAGRRSRVVLERMREERYITAAEEQAARRARFQFGPPPAVADARGGYAKEFLRQEFRDRFGGDHPPDWQVHTTLRPAVQDAAEQALAAGLERLGRPGLQAALVAIEPHTGDILALVGGRDVTRFPYNRAVRSRRQAGSAFKPFVYAAALEKGYSPVSVLDGLHAVSVSGREEWTPTNPHDFPDRQTLREALLQSNNQAAVLLQQRIGTGSVRHLAEAAGLRGLPDVPSLALGTGLLSPLELTAGFAIFPSGGYAVRPRAIRAVLDADGDIAEEDPVRVERVLSEEAAFQALTMLRDVVELGTAARARELGLRFPAGGKTGTTDDFKDAWFVGFSTAVVAGVWVGYDQPTPIGADAYGARVALPIWTDFMRRTARELPPGDFEPPPGVEARELCRVTYLRAVSECPAYVEYFKEGDEVPTQLCPLHGGSVKQRVSRAIDRFFERLGKRIKRIFK